LPLTHFRLIVKSTVGTEGWLTIDKMLFHKWWSLCCCFCELADWNQQPYQFPRLSFSMWCDWQRLASQTPMYCWSWNLLLFRVVCFVVFQWQPLHGYICKLLCLYSPWAWGWVCPAVSDTCLIH
jgi:hypothetical protein